MSRSRTVSDQMAKGVEFLFKKNKVEYVIGSGQVSVPGMVEVTDGPGKGKFFKTKNILIATGCKMRRLPGLEVDGTRVMTSREALAVTALPRSIIIVGAGAIGVEFAYFYNAFGTSVTLVEMLPQILPVEDEEVSKLLERSLVKQGIAVHTNTKCENFRVEKDSVKVTLVKDGQSQASRSRYGPVPRSASSPILTGALGPNKVKLDLDRNYVTVGDDYQTSVKGIYGAGDIIGPPWLAHVATYEAVSVVNGMFGYRQGPPGEELSRLHLLPAAGGEHGAHGEGGQGKEARLQDRQVPLYGFRQGSGSGRERGLRQSHFRRKDRRDSRACTSSAPKLYRADRQEYVLAMEMEGTIAEVHHSIHAHPTLTEAAGGGRRGDDRRGHSYLSSKRRSRRFPGQRATAGRAFTAASRALPTLSSPLISC